MTDKLTICGATAYKSTEVQEFLSTFHVKHTIFSTYNPHSNQRTEEAKKAANKMLVDSSVPSGTLNTKNFLAAQLAHRNKPNIVTGLSSSEVVFWKEIKDLLPFAPGKRLIST